MKKWKFSKDSNKQRIININNTFIGNKNKINVIAGPCSIESWEQIDSVGKLLNDLGIKFIRAGCFKPRTSPYSFKGLEAEGLEMLKEIKNKYKLNIVTEVKDATHVEKVANIADVVQIGAKAMWDYGILKYLSKTQKPVLVKRSFAATTQECCQIAEYLLNGGNENVMVCERGIRTFEPNSRFTLDLCGSAWIKKETNLPLVIDPSHAMGYSYGVPELALAAVATNPSAIMIEVHPNPKEAKSDANQQLDFKIFKDLYLKMKKVAFAVDSELV